METYNYLSAVINDVKEYVDYEIDLTDYASKDELEKYLEDILWAEDSVTGGRSGFYSDKPEDYLCNNLGLVKEAYDELGVQPDSDSPAAKDVTVRCYLLRRAIREVLQGIELPREKVEEEFNSIKREPCFEMENGSIVYIQYNKNDGTIETGGYTNWGFFPEHSFEYDYSLSLDVNLQGVYEELSQMPEYQSEEDEE